MIGPWTHGAQDKQKSGERNFGKDAAIDYDALILRWMDHYLRDGDGGVDVEKPVRIFVMGKNEWRDEQAWPLKRAHQEVLFLQSGPRDAAVNRLVPRLDVTTEGQSSFVSDPEQPLTDSYHAYGAHDYRALVGRKDVLTFDSEPMMEDVEVTGPIQAEMYVSADIQDFDLWVRLLDVAPDGTAFNLMSPGLDVLRASYRDETEKAKLVEAGKIYRLQLDRMVTSNAFLKGHRIRIQISGAFYPHFSRNLQTGRSEIVSQDMKAGRITIHHEAQYQSRIVLPVVRN
jgi:putative CocE/NonD family hydrolase